MTPEALEMSKKYAARVLELEKEVAELREEIHERSNKAMRIIGEITKERDTWMKAASWWEIEKTKEQLAAAQATNERLREALVSVDKAYSITAQSILLLDWQKAVKEALAIPHDSTELDARIRSAKVEALREAAEKVDLASYTARQELLRMADEIEKGEAE